MKHAIKNILYLIQVGTTFPVKTVSRLFEMRSARHRRKGGWGLYTREKRAVDEFQLEYGATLDKQKKNIVKL